MKKLTTLILCLLLAPIVVARPSLSGIDSKLDQLLARGAVDPAQIVALQSAGISDDPTCRVTYVRLTDDGGASEPFVVPPNQTLLLGDAYIRALSAPVAAGTTMTFQIKQSLPGSVDGRLLISTTSAPTPSPTVAEIGHTQLLATPAAATSGHRLCARAFRTGDSGFEDVAGFTSLLNGVLVPSALQ